MSIVVSDHRAARPRLPSVAAIAGLTVLGIAAVSVLLRRPGARSRNTDVSRPDLSPWLRQDLGLPPAEPGAQWERFR